MSGISSGAPGREDSDTGTPGMAAVYAQLGGLEVLREIGLPAIRQVTQALTEDLIGEAQARGLNPRGGSSRGSECNRDVSRVAPQEDVRRLAAQGFIVIPGRATCGFRPTSTTRPTITGPCSSACPVSKATRSSSTAPRPTSRAHRRRGDPESAQLQERP